MHKCVVYNGKRGREVVKWFLRKKVIIVFPTTEVFSISPGYIFQHGATKTLSA